MTTEKEMLERLWAGEIQLPPLIFERVDQLNPDKAMAFNASMEVTWKQKQWPFAVLCKALSTPKTFQASLNTLKQEPRPGRFNPLLLLPYLKEDQLRQLEKEGLSGLDLCGNGVMQVPGEFLIFRSGEKNRYPSSASIKNIYRKNSAMVSRVFLARPEFENVQEVQQEINRRNLMVRQGGKEPMSLSTVSKVLKTMEENLIISRKNGIRLLQPDKLLEELSRNYEYPPPKTRVTLKISWTKEEIPGMLARLSEALKMPLVATGKASVNQYAVMQRGELFSVYCPASRKLQDEIPGTETNRFPNLEIIETENQAVYFDAKSEADGIWASPVQVYLELMAGDKRDRETADQIRAHLFKTVGANR